MRMQSRDDTGTGITTAGTTTAGLLRGTGLAAMAAGIIFAAIQPIHPPDVLASVTTGAWALITGFKLVMCFLFLVGLAGISVRQMARAGWLGLVGFGLFSLSWALQSGFVFAEVFLLPTLSQASPGLADSFPGIVNGSPGTMKIGAIVPAYAMVGILYLTGGLLFGLATLRAGVFPGRPAGLALVTPAAVLLPHEIQRLAAMPMGLAWPCALVRAAVKPAPHLNDTNPSPSVIRTAPKDQSR